MKLPLPRGDGPVRHTHVSTRFVAEWTQCVHRLHSQAKWTSDRAKLGRMGTHLGRYVHGVQRSEDRAVGMIRIDARIFDSGTGVVALGGRTHALSAHDVGMRGQLLEGA